MHKYIFQCTNVFFSAQICFCKQISSQYTKLFLAPNGLKMAKRTWYYTVIEAWSHCLPHFRSVSSQIEASIECGGDLRNNHRIEMLKIWMNCSGTIFKRGFRTKYVVLFIKVSQHQNVYVKSSATIAWHGIKMKKYFLQHPGNTTKNS